MIAINRYFQVVTSHCLDSKRHGFIMLELLAGLILLVAVGLSTSRMLCLIGKNNRTLKERNHILAQVLIYGESINLPKNEDEVTQTTSPMQWLLANEKHQTTVTISVSRCIIKRGDQTLEFLHV